MANLRGGSTLWNNASVGSNGVSAGVGVGEAPYVAVLITNSGGVSTNITIQTSGAATVSSGVNADMTGATWYDYVTVAPITVAANTSLCYDLSPFAPPYIRLKSSAATTLSAVVVANG